MRRVYFYSINISQGRGLISVLGIFLLRKYMNKMDKAYGSDIPFLCKILEKHLLIKGN